MSYSSTSGGNIVVKIGLVGDSSVGKTCLMLKYVENKFDEDYKETLGVQYMEKNVNVKGNLITFQLWDLGGKEQFVGMLPNVCEGALVIIFTFDLTRPQSLNSIRDWFTKVRELNERALPFLVGTKFDLFVKLSEEHQTEVINKARRAARAMKSPLVFSSAQYSINIKKIFKIIFSKVFNQPCNIPEISEKGQPILEYEVKETKE